MTLSTLALDVLRAGCVLPDGPSQTVAVPHAPGGGDQASGAARIAGALAAPLAGPDGLGDTDRRGLPLGGGRRQPAPTCGATEASCVCELEPGHETKWHRCECGGEWSYASGEFEGRAWPGSAYADAGLALVSALEIVLGSTAYGLVLPGLDSLARLAELVGYHCRKPARPEPGRCPARIHYFTVETASGKRVVSTTVPLPHTKKGAKR